MVNITNVLSIQPIDLATWISLEILSKTEINLSGPNKTIDVQNEALPLLVTITNSLSLLTELYAVCTGSKVSHSLEKKNPIKKEESANAVTTLNAMIDILYRSIQSLEAKRDSVGRIITATNNMARLAAN